jgi:hypothetical protein
MLLEEESLCLRGIYLTLGVRGSVSVLNCAVWDLLCLGDGSSTYRLEMLIEWHYPPYKGKGIRYEGEYVARKVGKRA